LSDDEDFDKKSLSGLRASFNPIERAENARLKKIIKSQEYEIAILKKSAGMDDVLNMVQMPKAVRSKLGTSKPNKSFQLHLSDTHSREIVTRAITDGRNFHNVEVGRERLRSIILQAVRLIKEEARTCTPVHLTVWGGGDWMVNADLHYKMERCVDDEPLVEMGHVYDMLNEELGLLWSKTPTDSNSFIGSFSNHGRDSEQMCPGLEAARSYDTSIYNRLERDFTDVKFTIADTTWTVEDIYGFKTMYTHGHSKKVGMRRTPEGIMIPNWQAIREMKDNYQFGAWVQGHYHCKSILSGKKFTFAGNGSLVGENSYSAAEGFAGEPPSQNLLVVDVERNAVEKVVTLFA